MLCVIVSITQKCEGLQFVSIPGRRQIGISGIFRIRRRTLAAGIQVRTAHHDAVNVENIQRMAIISQV